MLKKIFAFTFIAAASIGGPIFAQADSRLAEIAARQDQKAADPKPVQQNKVERALIPFKGSALLNRFSDGLGGFRLKVGGLAPGSGFGIGPEYRRNGLLSGELNFRASAHGSFRGSQKFELGLTAPRLSGERFFAELYAVHHDYPTLSYYRPGADSRKTGRTDFRLEDTAVDATFGVRPVKHLTLASSAGYLFNNVGPRYGLPLCFGRADLLAGPSARHRCPVEFLARWRLRAV
jgi:hypothetical protein